MVLSLDGRPSCPEHPDAKVWLDGCYGPVGHRKQRYKCVLPSGYTHVFTEKLPRLRYDANVECDECEREVPHTHGPQHPRRFHFQARLIAKAMVEVGQASNSYRRIAQTIRREAERSGTVIPGLGFEPKKHGQLVADWVEVFAPVIYDELAVKEYPEIIVIDELPFKKRTRRSTGQLVRGGMPMFSILGIVGYTKQHKPFLFALEAVPLSANTGRWMQLFARFEGKPKRIVCDQAPMIYSAITLRWITPDTPEIHHCHWHIARRLEALLPKNRQQAGDPVFDAIQKALFDPQRFEDFLVLARQEPRFHRWIRRNAYKVRKQLENKKHPYSVGAIENHFNYLSKALGDRVYVFRNRERLNRMLMLVQLELNGQRSETHYARIIRDYLEAHDGIAPARHLILDPKGVSSLRI